ncbi:DUF3006 domain-containing protein [Clostridium sp. MSJ-4]|uniref:DUF3006 domain-containing protein n=1 Tax=Clostridium simiarum TaxID=2841506 RepID=A0ABS6EYY7_9CLOT|nr:MULTISPECIES: DUF3006 domain-containing protein [Clostridium]MBU5591434.1 DUF3006 domain-containing protein [Clostridium simiarum]
MEFQLGIDKYIVDRIEENIVIAEDNEGNIINIPLKNFKHPIKEGDIIFKEGETYFKDPVLTENRRKYVNDFMKGMWVDE